MSDKESYRLVPIPRSRRFSLDAGRVGHNRHIVHGLAEVDVTIARQLIRQHKEDTGESLSFTAFILHCLGKAIAQHPEMHAYRDWRNRLVIYEHINMVVIIEAELQGKRVPIPYLLYQADRKSFRQIHDEIRSAQTNPSRSREAGFMRWFLILPWPLRNLFYWTTLRIPHWFRQSSSSVLVTAVGMFSRGASWGITKPSHTLTLVLGGIALKPGVVEGRIEPREFLHITLSVDHDVVDGGPIARFGNQLMEMIESGHGLT